MFVGKQFDIVMGVDIHIIQPPGPVPPVPIPHPFIGMVFDPMEFVPMVGASIFVNGIPRAQAGTTVISTVPHIPIGGMFVKPPTNDGEIFMGSLTVNPEGEPFPFLGSPVLTCQDMGMVSIPRPNRKSKSKPKSLVLPVSTLLPVPKGGLCTITNNSLIISFATAISVAVLGYGIKKVIEKIKLNNLIKKISKKISRQKQLRHIKDKTEKSYLDSLEDAQEILDAVHTGKAKYLGQTKTGHSVFRYNKINGTNVNKGKGILSQKTNVFLIKGTSSPSIVPTNPFWKP